MSLTTAHLFSNTHEWTLDNHDGTVTVGVSDFAQVSLGDIMHVTLPSINQAVLAGDACCVLESLKTASDVHAPVAGTVIAVNDALNATPELINDDPYLSGWLFKIQLKVPLDPTAFLSHEEYQQSVE